jgi:hypothetical protein
MKEPDNYCYCKTEVSVAVSQIALYYPHRKEEVIAWFRDVFSFFLENSENDDLINIELNGLMVANVLDFNGSELRQEITDLYENGLVWPGISGSLEKVLRELDKLPLFDSKRKTYTLFSRYENILNSWNYDDGEDEPIEPDNIGQTHFLPPLIFKTPKIGRNDPCPCGSGKKYKKCCMK